MIDLYYTPSPNGHKITLFLEEAQLQYRLIHVDISKGSQFHPDFLQISPNNKIPAIIDTAPVDGGSPSACLSPEKFYSIWRKRVGSC
ncbi:glutathione S-transferase [Citrobacter freundii]|nr:glutathione S-transferase [Citrobacter freundii]